MDGGDCCVGAIDMWIPIRGMHRNRARIQNTMRMRRVTAVEYASCKQIRRARRIAQYNTVCSDPGYKAANPPAGCVEYRNMHAARGSRNCRARYGLLTARLRMAHARARDVRARLTGMRRRMRYGYADARARMVRDARARGIRARDKLECAGMRRI